MRSAMMCLVSLLNSGLCASAPAIDPILSADEMAFLEDITADVLEASRVPPDAKVGDIGPNTTGQTLIRPGGRNAYPAFWIRDYAMSLDAAMITPEEQRHALFLTASHQPDAEIVLPSGSVLPPGSIPDHISFGNVPIFFPGILEDYPAQGGPQWGHYPCLDDQFFFIHMAYAYWKQIGNNEFLREPVRGKTLLQRLEAAYEMPPARADTGLVLTTEEKRGVNFGFFDTTVHTGDLLYCSLLKRQAALELAELMGALGESGRANRYKNAAQTLGAAIERTFQMDNGYLRASTGLSAQTDVWGTAFAVYTRALSTEAERAACDALLRSLRDGTISWQGGIRHVPTNADFNADSAWERSYAEKNRYQNGAYWHTPTAWVCYAVAKADPLPARQLAQDFIAHLRADDFRKGDAFGAPWECRHEEELHRQNPVYLTSVSCPLAAFRTMLSENGQ